MKSIHIIIDGNPVAMPRPRFNKSGRTYYPKKITTQKEYIRNCIKRCMLAQDWQTMDKSIAVSVTLQFVHPRTKRMKSEQRTYKTTRPDIDNIIKMYLDCCTNVKIWHDDSQVTHVEASDHYAGMYEEPHTTIIIKRLT